MGKLCNGGRSAMVFQYHCRSSGGGGLQWGEGLQYNTGNKIIISIKRSTRYRYAMFISNPLMGPWMWSISSGFPDLSGQNNVTEYIVPSCATKIEGIIIESLSGTSWWKTHILVGMTAWQLIYCHFNLITCYNISSFTLKELGTPPWKLS